MYQNYIIEVKRLPSGDFEHNVFWVYDEDETKARLKAEAKYHEILASAAVSENKEHSAVMFTSKAEVIGSWCYEHTEG